MKQKYQTLTTEVKNPQVANRKPRTIRILPITDYGRQTRYYMNGWPLPVPAWMYHFNGWSVFGVVMLVVLALIGAGTGAAMLLRLLGQASTRGLSSKNREVWEVWAEWPGDKWFFAERTIDGEGEHHYFNAHCLACAKAEILTRHGGKVDLRGWHRQGQCGYFLRVVQSTVARMIEEEESGT